MHYVGQTHTVAVPLPVTLRDGTTGITRAHHASGFRGRLCGVVQPPAARHCRSASCRCGRAAIGRRPAFDLSALRAGAGSHRSKRRSRVRGRSGSTAAGTTRRYGRGSICRSAPSIEAPAILEQPDATIFIDPGLRGRVDRLGNLIVEADLA